MNTSNNVDTFGLVRVHYTQCDSTQTRMKHILSKTSPKQGLVISSDYQSAGKGQLGSKWSTLPDLNIAFSILFRPEGLPLDKQFYFNIWTALAIIQQLEEILPHQEIRVKWPNDIMVNDQKLGGILIQSSLRSNSLAYLILGVGINVNEPMNKYPFAATSLRDICKKSFNTKILQEIFISAIYNNCMRGLESFDFESSRKAFEKRLWKMGEEVKISEEGTVRTCKILGLDPSGELRISIDGAYRSIRHKEIEFLIK